MSVNSILSFSISIANLDRCHDLFYSSEPGEKSTLSDASTPGESPQTTTPKPRVKRSDTGDLSSGRSAPKLSRKVQSQEILQNQETEKGAKKRTRSPTVHYSPEEDEELEGLGEEEEAEDQEEDEPIEPPVPAKARKTAVKAKAKPNQDQIKKPKAATKPAKAEAREPTEEEARAIHASLARKATVDMNSAKKVATPSPATAAPMASASESEDGPAKIAEPQELTLKQVQARKAARARYMRFSRSLTSKSPLS